MLFQKDLVIEFPGSQEYIFIALFVAVHPCETDGNGGCEHICTPEGQEPICSCEKGYELETDNKKCKKLHPCDTEVIIGGCWSDAACKILIQTLLGSYLIIWAHNIDRETVLLNHSLASFWTFSLYTLCLCQMMQMLGYNKFTQRYLRN